MSSVSPRLPNFLIIGSAKSATTYMISRLARHPEAFAVEVPKEPCYFTFNHKNGLDWYTSLFRDAGGAKAVGESSPSYTERLNNPAPKRVAELIPEARLIYMVRHPVPRVQSHWLQDLQSGFYEQKPFNEAVRTMSHYVESSLYWSQLNRYREFFPDERILVLFQKDLKDDARGVVRQCVSFLGIDPDAEIPEVDRPVNTKADVRKVTGPLKAARAAGRFLLGGHKDTPLFRPIKSRITKALGREVPTPVYDDATRRWFVDRVRDDAAKLLAHCGKPADYWDFDRGDGQ